MRRKSTPLGQRNLVGPKLKELRVRRHLSQDLVVELLEARHGVKLDRSALTRLENQHRSIDDFEIKALAAVYKVTVEEVFAERNKKPGEDQ